MGIFFWVLHLIVLTWNFSEGSRILGVFPTPSISHQVVFQGLTKDLAARGHQLTIVSPDQMAAHANITQITVDGLYELKFKLMEELNESPKEAFAMIQWFSDFALKVMDTVLSYPDVQKLIENSNNQEFDLVIFEQLPMNLAAAAFGRIFNCPVVGITSLEAAFTVHDDFGNEGNAAVHPAMFLGYDSGELSLMERVKSLILNVMYLNMIDPNVLHSTNVMVQTHFPNITAYAQTLKKDVQLLMINTSPILGFIRPLVPKVIQLGFMHVEPPKALPNGELKSFLDKSEHGVIYMSLGSNSLTKDLGAQVVNVFVEVFRKSKYDVVWKYENEMPKKPANVMLGKWFPQSDLLAHPNVKLFITQGGQQSMEEAVYRAVPMLVLPMLFDQNANARKIEKKGIGRKLDSRFMSESYLQRMIDDTMLAKYKEKITELSEIIHDQPMTSREKAVWWCEHVIRHRGLQYLNYLGASVPFVERYYLDVAVLSYFIYRIAKRFVPWILRILFSWVKRLAQPLTFLLKHQFEQLKKLRQAKKSDAQNEVIEKVNAKSKKSKKKLKSG